MAKNKNIKESDIVNMYVEYILENREEPISVSVFTKHNNFEEDIFYKYFTNFEEIIQKIFISFLDQSLALLEKSEDYINYEARNKLLSFYFTFFELLTANKDYVKFVLKHTPKLKLMKLLTPFKKDFTNYITTLDIEKLNLQQKQLEHLQDTSLKEGAWIQLIFTVKFWLDDTSTSFEKTDIFIEKSINTSFDIINIQPLKSVIDFGKFLFKEKIMTT